MSSHLISSQVRAIHPHKKFQKNTRSDNKIQKSDISFSQFPLLYTFH